MLYKLGARIGEISNLEIKDITKDQYSSLVDLNGKTGRRTPRIVISSPYIAALGCQGKEKQADKDEIWFPESPDTKIGYQGWYKEEGLPYTYEYKGD
jgi:integrase